MGLGYEKRKICLKRWLCILQEVNKRIVIDSTSDLQKKDFAALTLFS